MEINRTLEDPFYYLANFHHVLEWIGKRYSDLLSQSEQAFVDSFPTLPQASRALLVRMVMRKGQIFRRSKLVYTEIGCIEQAVRPLIELGWVDDQPKVTLDQLFALLKKSELLTTFDLEKRRPEPKKGELLELLRPDFSNARLFGEWCGCLNDCLYEITLTPLCDRLRLMFFGNLHQDWTEFILSDLGVYRYEKVALSDASRGFRLRADVDDYLHLYRCREYFQAGEPVSAILEMLPARLNNEWLEGRRTKLLFEIGQACEQAGELLQALDIYQGCAYPGARIRMLRILERTECFAHAFELAMAASQAPESEAEAQVLVRMLPRLRRKLGMPTLPRPAARAVERIDLLLPRPVEPFSVERCVQAYMMQLEAPVFYVENSLINTLFGLLCWDAVFSDIPGAFFHPFHRAPADFATPHFFSRRAERFEACLAQLEKGSYKDTIRRTLRQKQGLQAPFVHWGLPEEVIELALHCLPAIHLRKWFERILWDIKSNRTGFPDLIQFWPAEQRYRMIEVKGPGDRLQDNQVRWLDFCVEHKMPVAVCYLQWEDTVCTM
ncbi:VRR-NUC domain-containing protein [Pseudomonas duriflava]|uniref:phosphodiesterase I n=1 Tax=Pseudomonas duriflava TaxID=459528 RepID=A0A562Q9E3_9PSED|nr:VRR-NUC domain-containing protein [Pseudomonas duriflava]TWI53343.1 VRR-NUC domain-containing protein [Pseudomonas duriflava]